jgi:hypothetical protein
MRKSWTPSCATSAVKARAQAHTTAHPTAHATWCTPALSSGVCARMLCARAVRVHDALTRVAFCVWLAGDREHELLLCHRFEVCGASAHVGCLGMSRVPEEDWECHRCLRRSAARRTRARAAAAPAAAAAPRARISLPDGAASADFDSDGVPYVLELSLTGPSDTAMLYLDRPPSPDAAALARERHWVARQRAITASVDAQRAHDAAADGAEALRAHAQRHTALRTVREMRNNWEQLRRGVLSFSAARESAAEPARPRAAAPQRLQRRARTLLPAAPGEAQEERVEEQPPGGRAAGSPDADAAQLSWQALETLQQQRPQQRQREQRGRGVAGDGVRRAAAARVAPPPSQPSPANDADGHMAHLACVRRRREAGVTAPYTQRQRAHPLSPPSPAAGAAPAPSGGGFRIPKRPKMEQADLTSDAMPLLSSAATASCMAMPIPAPQQLAELPRVRSFGTDAAASVALHPWAAATGDCEPAATRFAATARAPGAVGDVAAALSAPSPLSRPTVPPPAARVVDQRALREAHSRATAHAAAAAEDALKLPYRNGAISKEQCKEFAREAVRATAARLAPHWAATPASQAGEEAAAARSAVMEALHETLPALFP